MSKKRVLITGITGQDGSYLAEFLLAKDYEVFGLVRRSSTISFERIYHIQDRIEILSGDLLDQNSLSSALKEARPHEVYNLGAQSFVQASFQQPLLTGEITGLGVVRLLESIRSFDPQIRFYQASTSELFGKVQETPQNEETPFYPRSPYGIAKMYAHWIAINFRESYNMFCCAGILFNHESPRRGLEFVTRKITNGVAQIKLGQAEQLPLGNLEARRDWGHAGDFVRAMWLMLQQDEPEDFVIATGADRSIREFCQVAFAHADLDWQQYVVVDEKFFRPAEVNQLLGNAAKAREKLGWEPQISFEEMVHEMVDTDLKLAARRVL